LFISPKEKYRNDKREATQADVETVTRHPARFMGNLPGRKKDENSLSNGFVGVDLTIEK